MEDLTILTRQEPGVAEFSNFEEIKTYLDQQLSVYRNIVYSDDSLKTAKADKAQLNKLKKALNERRKEIKAVYMEPYLRIETQIKELTAMIDEPLQVIESFVKEMEEKERSEKRVEIYKWYCSVASSLGVLADRVFDAPGFVDDKWLNKSTRASEWQAALKEKIIKTASDISVIQSSAGQYSTAVLTNYLDGLDLEAAKEYKKSLEKTDSVAQTEVSVQDDDHVIGFKILKLFGTQRQMEQIFEQIELMGMEVDILEDGMPQPMQELLQPGFNSFVSFDIETSGTYGAGNGDSPAEITEIGAVKVVNGEVIDKFDMLCNPGRKIVPRIAKLTNITDEMVKDAPSVAEVIREFASYVGNLPLVGHNIKSSDLHYISRAASKAGVHLENSFFDTYLYAKQFQQSMGWETVKLEYLSQYFGISQPSAHRAWCDAEANVGVYFKLKDLSSDT